MSFLENRLSASLVFLKQDSGYISVAIDDNEIANLSSLIKVEYPQFDLHKVIVNHYPGSGTGRSNVSRTHEYSLFMVQIGRSDIVEEILLDGGSNDLREDRPKLFLPIAVNKEKTISASGRR